MSVFSNAVAAEPWKLRPDQMISAETYYTQLTLACNQSATLRARKPGYTPWSMPPIPLGAWRIDSYALMYGHMIEQLCRVDPESLTFTEDTSDKLYVASCYACWMKQGYTDIPPIEVISNDHGKWVVTNGHRRVLAAIQAGLSMIPAWVSWGLDTTKKTVDGKRITQPYTYEYAVLDEHFRRGHQCPADVLDIVLRWVRAKNNSELWSLFPEVSRPCAPLMAMEYAL